MTALHARWTQFGKEPALTLAPHDPALPQVTTLLRSAAPGLLAFARDQRLHGPDIRPGTRFSVLTLDGDGQATGERSAFLFGGALHASRPTRGGIEQPTRAGRVVTDLPILHDRDHWQVWAWLLLGLTLAATSRLGLSLSGKALHLHPDDRELSLDLLPLDRGDVPRRAADLACMTRVRDLLGKGALPHDPLAFAAMVAGVGKDMA